PTNTGWKAGNSTLSIWAGGNTPAATSDLEISADYAGAYDSTGIWDWATPSSIPSNAYLIPVNIAVTQNPKFTGDFAIWQPTNPPMPNNYFWQPEDYVEFGMWDHLNHIGF